MVYRKEKCTYIVSKVGSNALNLTIRGNCIIIAIHKSYRRLFTGGYVY